MNGQIDRLTDGRTNERADVQIVGRTNVQMDGRTDGRMEERVAEVFLTLAVLSRNVHG